MPACSGEGSLHPSRDRPAADPWTAFPSLMPQPFMQRGGLLPSSQCEGWAQLPILQALSPPHSSAHCQSFMEWLVPWWPPQGTVVGGISPCKGLTWHAGQRGAGLLEVPSLGATSSHRRPAQERPHFLFHPPSPLS